MKIKQVLASGMVLAQLGSLGVGLANVSAAELTIPEYDTVNKSSALDYILSFNQFKGVQKSVVEDNTTPVPNNSTEATSSAVRGASYQIRQIEDIMLDGSVVEVAGDTNIFEMDGLLNKVTVSEDGTYEIKQVTRAWGYKHDFSETGEVNVYKYSFPVYKDGVESDTQQLDVNLKFDEIFGAINDSGEPGTTPFYKVGEEGEALMGAEFKLTQLYDAKTGDVGRGVGIGTQVVKSDEFGSVEFTDLTEGIYEVQEINSIEGYAVDKDILLYQVTLDEGTNDVVVRQVSREQATLMLTTQSAKELVLPAAEKGMDTLGGEFDVVDKDDINGTFDNSRLPDIEKSVRTHDVMDGVRLDGNADLEASFVKLEDGTPLSNLDRTIEYKFTLNLPKDIKRYDTYTITDQLSADNFDLESVNPAEVKVLNGSREVTSTISYVGGLLTVDFTSEQLQGLDGEEDLTVLFNVNLNPNLAVTDDTRVDNEVKLTFDNGAGAKGEKSSIVTIKPTEGNLHLTKIDGQDDTIKLKGAEFLLLRQVDDVEIAKDAVDMDVVNGVEAKLGELGVKNNTGKQLVYATHSNGSEVGTVITGDNGLAEIANLPLGTYYLVETKAPTGAKGETYRLNKTLSDAIVIEDSLEDDVALNLAETSVKNFLQSDRYPATGTWGYYGLVGVAVVAGLGSIVLGRFKADEESEQA